MEILATTAAAGTQVETMDELGAEVASLLQETTPAAATSARHMQMLRPEGPRLDSCYRRLSERSSDERMMRDPRLPLPRARRVGKGLRMEAAETTVE